MSTNSEHDLRHYNSELIVFKKFIKKSRNSFANLLSFENIWFVGAPQDCSCGFRHMMTDDLGFSEPVDWYEEDETEIEATKQFYAVIKEIIKSGNAVDCLDKWEGTNVKDIKRKVVMLSQVSQVEFRFFENYLFKFDE